RWPACRDGRRADETRSLHRDDRRLRASVSSRTRLRADAAIRHLAPDRVARGNSLPACLHQQSLGDCALPATGDGNPPPPSCDGVEERGLIVLTDTILTRFGYRPVPDRGRDPGRTPPWSACRYNGSSPW